MSVARVVSLQWRVPLAGRRRDGTTFPAEVSRSAIETDEGLLVTAVARDVTERLEILAERERLRAQAERDKLERQLHQSQRLESLGQLAGGVAHDFNNLLGVISSYAAFAREEVARELPSERWQAVHADIEQAEQAAGRAAGLTHQLLAFARQEVIQPCVLDLNQVVTSVEQLLARTLGEHVELVTDLSAELEPVLADPGQIDQVLVNLAVNARDAMPGGGKLIIQTSSADIDQLVPGHAGQPSLAPGRYAVVKVSDTGTGSPKTSLNGCSSRSSPPSPRAREPASASPPSTASSPRPGAPCGSTPSPVWAPSSPSCCPSPPSPRTARSRRPPGRSAATARQ